MVSFSNYDLSNVKANDFEVIPPGDYPAIITECEEKPTKDGGGMRLNLKIQIIDGKYQNRTLYDGLNTVNKSATAQQIGRSQLKSICIALNKVTAKDSSELLNEPLMVTVKIGNDKEGNPRSEIKGYKARLAAAKPVEKNLVEQAFEAEKSEATKTTTRVNPYAS